MHKTILSVLLLMTIAIPGISRAQYGQSSASFSLERWEEDYSYLKDPSQRTDFFDPIKYVPIDAKDDVYVSFGGQARYRYDYFNNPSFGSSAVDDEDGWHLQRYLLHADFHAGEHFRAFVQVDRSWVDGRTGGGRYGDWDAIDLQQAFVDLSTSADADPYVNLRLGRQELIYGAQRFISPDDWRNVRRWFDGGKLSISVPNDTLDIFVTRGMTIQRDEYNDNDPGLYFSGIYNSTALPDLIGGATGGANSKLELYALLLNTTRHSIPAVDADTYTLGARFSTKPKPWDFDVESDYQFGDVESDDLHAWSIASEIGYTLESLEFSPRASVGLDAASGSPDVGGRFNQLFPPTYNYLGHAYLFGRTNLVDAHVGVDVHLPHDMTLYLAQHAYWRENTNDALYNLSGKVVRADNGSDASYVGNEFDISLFWQIDKHLSAYAGWAHFFAGDFISQTGASKDVDFAYASVTFTF